MEVVDGNVLRFFRDLQTFFLPLSSCLYKWTVAPTSITKDAAWKNIAGMDWVQLPPSSDTLTSESDTRLYYELFETRAFFRRKLCEINGETFQVSKAGVKQIFGDMHPTAKRNDFLGTNLSQF